MKNILTILIQIIFFHCSLISQTDNCFQNLFNKGIKDYNKENFDSAIRNFLASQTCPSITQEESIKVIDWIFKVQNTQKKLLQESIYLSKKVSEEKDSLSKLVEKLILRNDTTRNNLKIKHHRTGKDYALLIAINEYQDYQSWKKLKNPIHDAKTIRMLLQDYFGFETVLYQNPNLKEIDDLLIRWQNRTFAKDDQLFIFFTGHGYFREENLKGYLVPSDGEGTNYRTFFDLTDIGGMVSNIPCKHILLAIDACFSGTIDQEIAYKGKPTFRRPGATPQVNLNNFVQKQLEFPTRFVITSGGKERTPDGDDHSPFANAIINGLRNAYKNENILAYQELLLRLSFVNPTPYHGKLIGHKNGGFVFVSKN